MHVVTRRKQASWGKSISFPEAIPGDMEDKEIVVAPELGEVLERVKCEEEDILKAAISIGEDNKKAEMLARRIHGDKETFPINLKYLEQ